MQELWVVVRRLLRVCTATGTGTGTGTGMPLPAGAKGAHGYAKWQGVGAATHSSGIPLAKGLM